MAIKIYSFFFLHLIQSLLSFTRDILRMLLIPKERFGTLGDQKDKINKPIELFIGLPRCSIIFTAEVIT